MDISCSTGHNNIMCTCSLPCRRSLWLKCCFPITCSTAEWWGLSLWPRHRRTESPPEQLVMMRPFGTLLRTNKRDLFTLAHTQKKLYKQNSFVLWHGILEEWEHVSVALCVSVCVNDSLSEACKHLELRCTSGYYSLSDWHSQPLVSDDKSTWLGTALRKSALAHRHTYTQREPSKHTQSSSSLNSSWNHKALPCHWPTTDKKAGKEGRKRYWKRGKKSERKGGRREKAYVQ